MRELQKNKMSAGAEIENLVSFELKILGISGDGNVRLLCFSRRKQNILYRGLVLDASVLFFYRRCAALSAIDLPQGQAGGQGHPGRQPAEGDGPIEDVCGRV